MGDINPHRLRNTSSIALFCDAGQGGAVRVADAPAARIARARFPLYRDASTLNYPKKVQAGSGNYNITRLQYGARKPCDPAAGSSRVGLPALYC